MTSLRRRLALRILAFDSIVVAFMAIGVLFKQIPMNQAGLFSFGFTTGSVAAFASFEDLTLVETPEATEP